MRTVLASMFALCVLLAHASCGAANGASDDATISRSSMVVVSAHLGDHRDAIGAGVVVARGPYGLRILTARHVAAAGDVTVWIEGVGYRSDMVRTFAHRDLAIVDTIVPAPARARLRPATLAAAIANDDAILVWGEDDSGPRLERGRVVDTRYRAPNDSEKPLLLDIACERCARGDSGGGVFDRQGRLIGILVARYRASDQRILATVAELVDPSLFASAESELQATAGSEPTTVRSQNEPKLSPD